MSSPTDPPLPGDPPPPTDPRLSTDPPSTTDPAPAPPAPRRRRLLFWTALALSLALAVGGGAYAVTTYQALIDPERVVGDYLAAVASGDAAGALAYGDLPEGDDGMLTREVLAAQLAIAPISDITVAVDAPVGDEATARVRYELGFMDGAQTVEDTITLSREGGTWQLTTVAVPVTVRVLNAPNRASIAGAKVPSGGQLMFPGALPVAFDTDNLALDAASRVVRFSQEDTVQEVAELSAAGEAAVGAAFDGAVDACVAGTADTQVLCPLPFDPRAVPGTLRGAAADPASEDVFIATQPGNDGLVRISGELTVTGEYQLLDYNNQPLTETGEFTVRILAACFASAPQDIIWRLT